MPDTKSGDWRSISAGKIAARDALIPAEWKLKDVVPDSVLDVTGIPESSGILSEEELRITNADTSEILSRVHAGVWKARAVAVAFCKRAAIAQQLVRILCFSGRCSIIMKF